MYLRDLQDEDFEVAIKVKILSYNPSSPHSPWPKQIQKFLFFLLYGLHQGEGMKAEAVNTQIYMIFNLYCLTFSVTPNRWTDGPMDQWTNGPRE